MRVLLSVLALLSAFASTRAEAQVERYALLVGENRGAQDEVTLRYAESDARKMRDVLSDIGGFAPENIVLISRTDAGAMRRALIALNDRLRASSKKTLLLVYYSGHADAAALHLGDTRFPTSELEQLVRGSAADVRLLILDSCRSGSVTRVKGGKRTGAFAIKLDQELASTGAVFLTSSSSNEDAQESDALTGSFFTHYLVSGLLGSADVNQDGEVVLSEAYSYAYDNTIRASSRTLAGIQHPTFRYDLSGKGDVVLTNPGAAKGDRAWLSFPEGRSYLVLSGNEHGDVVAEVGAATKNRRLSLRSGTYYVRARGRDHLLEGTVALKAGAQVLVESKMLTRSDYARLVRKGSAVLEQVHGPLAGATVHTALSNSDGLCPGFYAGYGFEFPHLDTSVRLQGCRSGFVMDPLTSRLNEIGLQVRVGRALDLPLLTVAPYLGLGLGVFAQTFETPGKAPSRTTAFGHVDAGIDLRAMLYSGLYLSVDTAVETYAFRQGTTESLSPSVALRSSLGVGWLY